MTATTSMNQRACAAKKLHSNAARWPSAGRCGMRPVKYAAIRSAGPIATSSSVSARRLEVIVVYAALGIALCAR